jgi:hypothetical protein
MAQRAFYSLFALLLAGCFPPGEGVDPPADRTVYFPVGLALDEGARHLFIANSDFDLQYNAGTVESWDLENLKKRLPTFCRGDADCAEGGGVCDTAALRDALTAKRGRDAGIPSNWCVTDPDDPRPCPYSSEQSPSSRSLYPGRCNPLNPRDRRGDGAPKISVSSTRIGAFATDIVYRARPPGAPEGPSGRLFIPVRGDATLHWIDVDDGDADDGKLECGGGDTCDEGHRRGNDPSAENTRGLAMLPEPFGIDADESGDWLVVTNQTSAAVGLFQNQWGEGLGGGFANGPLYQYTLAGLAGQPTAVVSVPSARANAAAGQADLPEFLIDYRGVAAIDLLRVYPDSASDPPRPYAKAPTGQGIFTNANGSDSRGMAVDRSLRRAAEDQCAVRFGIAPGCEVGGEGCAELPDGYVSCLQTAGAIPLDVLVTNRAPASLLVGATQQVVAQPGSYDLPAFNGVVPLGFGPARVVVGNVKNLDGQPERRAFAISFDSHRIVVYDPDRRTIEAEILTGRGPQAMAIDSTRALGYVAHFTDSYIGVVDLDQSHSTYATMIASVEAPVPPRASK